jgi:hypothetical protein
VDSSEDIQVCGERDYLDWNIDCLVYIDKGKEDPPPPFSPTIVDKKGRVQFLRENKGGFERRGLWVTSPPFVC